MHLNSIGGNNYDQDCIQHVSLFCYLIQDWMGCNLVHFVLKQFRSPFNMYMLQLFLFYVFKKYE